MLKLPAAGISPADVVTLGQLIALVTFQVRVIAGLRALAAEGRGDVAPPAADTQPFVHPANLPPPGEPDTQASPDSARANETTSERGPNEGDGLRMPTLVSA